MIYITKLEAKNAYVLLSTAFEESSIIWTTLIKKEITLRRYLRRNSLDELKVGEDRVHGVGWEEEDGVEDSDLEAVLFLKLSWSYTVSRNELGGFEVDLDEHAVLIHGNHSPVDYFCLWVEHCVGVLES